MKVDVGSTMPMGRGRKTAYAVLGLLILTVFVLSLVQLWFIYSTDEMPAFGSVPAGENGLPNADQRGAFLLLNEPHATNYAGPLVQLLATTEPGVVDEKVGAHLKATELNAVYVQSAVVGDGSDYRVYRLGDQIEQKMATERQPNGKALAIRPANGTWEPGPYVVDVPSDGMFGGRTYYQFFVDAQ